VAGKEAELQRLRAELNKFQSVLDAKSPVPGAGPLGGVAKKKKKIIYLSRNKTIATTARSYTDRLPGKV